MRTHGLGHSQSVVRHGEVFSSFKLTDLSPDHYWSAKANRAAYLDYNGGAFSTANDRVGTLLDVAETPVGDNLVVNGDFSQGTTGWTVTNTPNISGGVYYPGSDGSVQQWVDVTQDEEYALSVVVSKTASADAGIDFNHADNTDAWFKNSWSTTGTHADTFEQALFVNATGDRFRPSAFNFSNNGAWGVHEMAVRLPSGKRMAALGSSSSPILRNAGYTRLDFDGVNDIFTANAALSGTVTVLVIGDFSGLTGNNRVMSLAAASGSDWNTAGAAAFEHGSDGISLTREGSKRSFLSDKNERYFLLEISDQGHLSFGPSGVDNVQSRGAIAAETISVGGQNSATFTGDYAQVSIAEIAIWSGALNADQRALAMAYAASVAERIT